MADKKQITVIVPIHKFDDEVKTMLSKAIESVDTNLCNVLFVGPNDVLLQLKEIYKDATLVVNNDDTNVFQQVNKGVMQCVTPYFTVLEFDDAFLPSWSKILPKEIDDNAITMPLNEYISEDKFVGFGNEIVWDAAFISDNGTIGYLGEDELKLFSDFNVTGSIIKTEDFIALGNLNPNFKYLTWYEFLLRVTRNGKKIYIVPRVCYSHTLNRKGSYMDQVKNNISTEEANALIKEILEK